MERSQFNCAPVQQHRFSGIANHVRGDLAGTNVAHVTMALLRFTMSQCLIKVAPLFVYKPQVAILRFRPEVVLGILLVCPSEVLLGGGIEITDSEGNTTAYDYDALGRLLTLIQPD